MCVHIAGFPESWNRARIKEFAGRHTGTEVLNVVQSGTKTTICFRKVTFFFGLTEINFVARIFLKQKKSGSALESFCFFVL